MKKASQSYRGLEKLLGPRRRKLRNRIVGSKNYANLRFAIFRDVAQPGSALAWGARGREFESRHPDQRKAFFVEDKKGFFIACKSKLRWQALVQQRIKKTTSVQQMKA